MCSEVDTPRESLVLRAFQVRLIVRSVVATVEPWVCGRGEPVSGGDWLNLFWDEEEPPGCGGSWCGWCRLGAGGVDVGVRLRPLCVQSLRLGERVDHGVCAKQSGD